MFISSLIDYPMDRFLFFYNYDFALKPENTLFNIYKTYHRTTYTV